MITKIKLEKESIVFETAGKASGVFTKATDIEDFLPGGWEENPQLEVEYCLITNFSKLPSKTKPLARTLRQKLIKIDSFYLTKITQKQIGGNVILTYSEETETDESKATETDKIDFEAPLNICVKETKTFSAEISPEESLAPWYYQKELVDYRKTFAKAKAKAKALKKEDTKKEVEEKGRKPSKGIKSYTPFLSDYISFRYQTDTHGDIGAYIAPKNGQNTTIKDIKEHASKENISVSELIRELFLSYHDECIKNIRRELEILNIAKHKNWESVKRIADEPHLYTSLMRKISDKEFLESDAGTAWKQAICKLIPNLNNDLSGFEAFLEKDFKNRFISVASLKFPFNKYDVYEKCARDCDLSDSDEKIFEKYSEKYPFEQEIVTTANIPFESDRFKPVSPRERIYLSSINKETDCLNSRTVESVGIEAEVSFYGDLLAPVTGGSFDSFAIVGPENAYQAVDKSLEIIGSIKPDVPHYALWALLRRPEIKAQINSYYDPNIKNICFRTIFSKIELADIDIEDMKTPLTESCYEIARLASCSRYPQRLLNYNFTRIIQNMMSYNNWKRYALLHKINVISRTRRMEKKTCLVIYGNKTLFAEKIKAFLNCQCVNISDLEKQKELYDLYKKIVDFDLCIIAIDFENLQEVEIAKTILNIVSSNHLIIEEGDKTSDIKDSLPPPYVMDHFINSVNGEKLNYCKYNEADWKIYGNIRLLLDDDDFVWNTYRDFLITLGDCTPENFKKIPCKNSDSSGTRRSYSRNEFDLFENLKNLLTKHALFLNQEKDKMVLPPEFFKIEMLKIFESKLSDSFRQICGAALAKEMDEKSVREVLNRVWKSFEEEYKDDLPSVSLETFIKEFIGKVLKRAWESLEEEYKDDLSSVSLETFISDNICYIDSMRDRFPFIISLVLNGKNC